MGIYIHTMLLVLDTTTICWLYLINDGISVEGNSAEVEWRGTGVVDYSQSLFEYECRVDAGSPELCMSIKYIQHNFVPVNYTVDMHKFILFHFRHITAHFQWAIQWATSNPHKTHWQSLCVSLQTMEELRCVH